MIRSQQSKVQNIDFQQFTKITSNDSDSQIQLNPFKRRRQTAKWSYIQFIQQVLQKEEKLGFKINSHAPYTIYEDLKLILEINQRKQATPDVFKQISKNKILSKKSQSLQKRYKDVLFFIRQQEMKIILLFVSQFGLRGEIFFQNGQMKIYPTSEYEQDQQQLEEIIQIRETQNDKSPALIQASPSPLEANAIQESSNQLLQICEIQEVDMKSKFSEVIELKQLNDVLSFCSTFYQVDIRELFEILDSLSGNLQSLGFYLSKREEMIRWCSYEDQALVKKDERVIRYLQNNKGRKLVQQRRKYICEF